MNLRDFTRKYGLIIGLSFLVILMIGIKIANKNTEWENIEENNSENKEETVATEEEINLKNDYPLWEKLPYNGDGFTVERYEGKLTLMVNNQNEEVLKTIKEINNWFLENNIATESHRLIITNQTEN